MLFVAEYELEWDALETAVAKRVEWDEIQPEGFRFVGEYIWQDRDPPFRGVAVVEANDVEALNSFALHYGPTVKMRVHPATDVRSGIALVSGDGRRQQAGRTRGEAGAGLRSAASRPPRSKKAPRRAR
jgi:hypothetical protein